MMHCLGMDGFAALRVFVSTKLRSPIKNKTLYVLFESEFYAYCI